MSIYGSNHEKGIINVSYRMDSAIAADCHCASAERVDSSSVLEAKVSLVFKSSPCGESLLRLILRWGPARGFSKLKRHFPNYVTVFQVLGKLSTGSPHLSSPGDHCQPDNPLPCKLESLCNDATVP